MLYLMPGRASQTNYRFAGWLTRSHYKRAPLLGVGCDRWHHDLRKEQSSEKYIGLDVHQATISVAVLDSRGKLVMESIVETKAATILDFFAGLRGTLSVTFEEGTWAAWLYDLLK